MSLPGRAPTLEQIKDASRKFSNGVLGLEDLFQRAKRVVAAEKIRSKQEANQQADEACVTNVQAQILGETDQVLRFGRECISAFSVRQVDLYFASSGDEQSKVDLRLAIEVATLVFIGQSLLVDSIIKNKTAEFLGKDLLSRLLRKSGIERAIERTGHWITAHPVWSALIIGVAAVLGGIAVGITAGSCVAGVVSGAVASGLLAGGAVSISILANKVTKLHSLPRSEDFLKGLERICNGESAAALEIVLALKKMSVSVLEVNAGNLKIKLGDDLGRCAVCQKDFIDSQKIVVNGTDKDCAKHYIHAECYNDWKSTPENVRRRVLNCIICKKQLATVHIKTLRTGENQGGDWVDFIANFNY